MKIIQVLRVLNVKDNGDIEAEVIGKNLFFSPYVAQHTFSRSESGNTLYKKANRKGGELSNALLAVPLRHKVNEFLWAKKNAASN